MALPQRAVDESPEALALSELEAIRRGDRPRPPTMDLRGLYLSDADLSGMDLSGYDLAGADLSRSDLSGARLLRADLSGATLIDARLDGADLSGAQLCEAQLEHCQARRAGFGQADLSGAVLMSGSFEEASFTQARLVGADLRATRCRGARFREANLSDVEASGAVLRDCDLSEAIVAGAHFRDTDLRHSTLSGVRGYKRADWVRADIREADFTGAYLMRRFAMDQNYLEEFRTQNAAHEWLYRLWWLTSDCGRSFARWGGLTAINALAFAGIYTRVGADWGAHETWLSPLYFSVVTLTTLGYGDVRPTTLLGQLVVMSQVTSGYVMLGGLMSIFSNKMARRAD